MADFHRTPNGEFFAAIPFEAEGGGAAHVEVVAEMVQVTAITPVLKATTTLTRRETRARSRWRCSRRASRSRKRRNDGRSRAP
jgi:hypothetical protein